MISERAREAVESADTDRLLHIVDDHCREGEWDLLVELRIHCRAALERGKQLWGVEEHIRYRLALEAPGSFAGPAVAEGPTRFTLGPLPEVAASRHTWSELDAYLGPGPERAMFAHERVVRGEDLRDASVDPSILELPLALEEWEPSYPLVEYHSSRVETPNPRIPRMDEIRSKRGARIDDDLTTDALAALVTPWVEQSNGRAEAIAVEGNAVEALGSLGAVRAFVARIPPAAGMEWMAWAAASGGAHGRRRGAAAGRFGAWWAAAALTGLDWSPDPGELGTAIDDLRWWIWSDGATTGWTLRLAVEDPAAGLAWAIGAVDEE